MLNKSLKTILLPIILLASLIPFGTASAYEQASYVVVEKFENFEIRQYESLIIAEVEVTGEFSEVGNKSFRTLFNFISGDNVSSDPASTASPSSEIASEEISMTTPVLQKRTQQPGHYTFSFVMPSEYTLESLPKPISDKITIKEIPNRLIAARRYSGRWTESNYRKNESALMSALQSNQLETTGDPIYARYNAPFSLWFMRRNEVLIELKSL